MTLVTAIEKLLKRIGKPMTTNEIATELNKLKWYNKGDRSALTSSQIAARVHNNPRAFVRLGPLIYLKKTERPWNNGETKIRKSVTRARTSNPKWHRDEIILALDLYFQLKPGQIHARTPQVVELSEILNKLPIHEFKPNREKFRNPNGVGLKLSNFLAIDPSYEGKGMDAYSRLDKAIFEEFSNDRITLHRIATSIRKIVADNKVKDELERIPISADEQYDHVKEGRVIFKLHKYRERDSKIVQKKKKLHLERYGYLRCEVCDFDFYQIYGHLGFGFIECHHKLPLAMVQVETKTRIDDLALVCSNCHRMLHRNIDALTVEGLRRMLLHQ